MRVKLLGLGRPVKFTLFLEEVSVIVREIHNDKLRKVAMAERTPATECSNIGQLAEQRYQAMSYERAKEKVFGV